ncbi:MAG: hypothetical protein ACKPJJ_33740, partial [Planctomycetaceae bacterium]
WGDPRLSQQITGLPGDGDRKSMTAGDGKIADRVNSEYERFASGDTNWRQESTGVFEPAVGSKFVAGSQQAIISADFCVINPVGESSTGMSCQKTGEMRYYGISVAVVVYEM